jgi:hypothetical protein
MCQCVTRANRLIEAYHDELQDSDPGKRYAAFTAIHALRQVVGVERSELAVSCAAYRQACALPHEDAGECRT